MNCKNINDSLISYLEGSLEKSELKEFSSHIKSCDECYHVLNEVNKTYRLIDIKRKINVSDDFYQSTLSNLKKDKKTRIRNIFYNAVKPIAVAASIGLGILIGNGELIIQSSPIIEDTEIGDLMTPSTPSAFSVWESLDIENGN